MKHIYWDKMMLDGLQSILDEQRKMKKDEEVRMKEKFCNYKPNESSNGTGRKDNSCLEMQYVFLSKIMLDGLQFHLDEQRKKKEAKMTIEEGK